MLSPKVRFPSFCGCVVFHCVNVPQIFYPLIYWWALGPFPDLGYYISNVNNASVNIGVHIFFWMSVLGILAYFPRSGVTRSKGSCILNFLKTLHSVFHSGCTSLYSHQQCTRVTFLPASSPTLVVCWFINDSRFGRCEMISHCGFNLHLSDD